MRKVASWLSAWEIYPILFIAGFLRLYLINTSEFDEDQAMVFRMAYDAIHHGLVPATSNFSSIHLANPPAVVSLLMLPAAFSANPLWGAVLVGLFNVAAVLLTYIFVRRYYGRFAGIIAALLYATAAQPLLYSRFIWQQNMIAPFVVLFLFALFRGVVERRTGWLFPALLLLGILVQLHETTIILVVLLPVALLLAPGTLRWRDLVLGIGSLLLIFSTYLVWEISTKFFDAHIILQVLKLPNHIDNQAFTLYLLFLNSYNYIPTNPHTLVFALFPVLKWAHRIMLLLVIGGFAAALTGVILGRTRWRIFHVEKQEPTRGDASVPTPHPPHPRSYARDMWTAFRADPHRCGFILLLLWQIIPILLLSRHSVPLYPYYLLMLMPGPFILIGLFLSKVAQLFQQPGIRWNIPRYGVYTFGCLVIIAQLVGSTAWLIDGTSGNNLHSYAYNTLNSLEDALHEADQLAQQRHFNHVYIATDQYTQDALRYLAEQMQTPTTLFDSAQCLILPGPAAGPAVLLVGPSDSMTRVLLNHFATATLVDRPKRLGGVPFQLYIIRPIAEPQPSSSAFVNSLQLLDNHAQHLSADNSLWLTTRWRLIHAASPAYRTVYTYDITVLLNGRSSLSITSECISTSLRAGDQAIVAFQLPAGVSVPASVTIFAKSFTTVPYDLSYGPLHLEDMRDRRTLWTTLHTTQGTDSIALSA